jgi:hypothetical protein
MTGDLIRLRGHVGQAEVNARGISYEVRWGIVTVPSEDVEPLLHIGGFYRAHEDDPSALHSTLADVEAAVWSLPLGPARTALLATLNSAGAL